MSRDMTKPTRWLCAQRRFRSAWASTHAVWSDSSLSAWRKLGPLATHEAHSEDSDQTGRMPRLIWVFAGRTATLLVLSCRGSITGWTSILANWMPDVFFTELNLNFLYFNANCVDHESMLSWSTLFDKLACTNVLINSTSVVRQQVNVFDRTLLPTYGGNRKRKWAATWQNQQKECAPSEDSDQPGYPPSLIRVFTVCMKRACVLSYLLSAQQRLWSDWADAQADLSLRWAHSHFVGFVMPRLK